MINLNRLKLIGVVFVLVFLTGCIVYEKDYITAEEHYLVGWILHNIDEDTPTNLDYSEEDFAVYTYSFNYPSTQPLIFDNNIFWLPPKHKIEDINPSITTTIRLSSPLDRAYYIKGENTAPEHYSSDWSFRNFVDISYFYDSNKINSEHYLSENPNNGISPVPGDKKHIYFGKAPYTPASIIVQDNEIRLNGHLLRGYNDNSYLLRDDTSSPPSYQIFYNGELQKEKELVDFDYSKLSYSIEEDGTYEVKLTIPTNYPVWNTIEIAASFTVPSPELQPPELQHIEANPYFVAGEEYDILIDMHDESGIEDVEMHAETEFEGEGTSIVLVPDLIDEENQIYKASFTPDEDFNNFNLGITATDILGNSVSYYIKPVALPAQSINFNLKAEKDIVSKGDKIKISGVCETSDKEICNNFLIRYFINDEFNQTDTTGDFGEFEFEWKVPVIYDKEEVDATTRYAGTGIYLPHEEKLTISVETYDFDVGIFDMKISEPEVGKPVTVSATAQNLGLNDIADILVEFKVDGVLLGEITISKLKIKEEELVEFEWLPEREDFYTIGLTSTAKDDQNPSNNVLEQKTKINFIAPDLTGFIISESIKNIIINEERDIEFDIFNVGEEKAKGIEAQLYDFYKPEFVFLYFPSKIEEEEEVEEEPAEPEEEPAEEIEGEEEAESEEKPIPEEEDEEEEIVSTARKVTYNGVTYEFLAYKDGPYIIAKVSTDEFEETLSFSSSDRIKKLQNGIFLYLDYFSPFSAQFIIGKAAIIKKELEDLDVFGQITESIRWAPKISEEYLLLLFVDSSKDSNFENNYFEEYVKVLPIGVNIEAELPIDYKKQFIVDSQVDITARITNFGTQDAKNIRVSLFEQKQEYERGDLVPKVKKTQIGKEEIDTLEQNEGQDINFSWTPSKPGENFLLLLAETKHDINPEDNDDLRFIDVLSKEADVYSVLYYPRTDIFINEKVEIVGSIFNHGQIDARDVSAVLYEIKDDERKLVENKSIEIVEVDEEFRVNFDWTPTSSGELFLELAAEVSDDGNKDNNVDSIPIVVLVKDFDVKPTIISYPQFILANNNVFVTILLQNFGSKDATEFDLSLTANAGQVDNIIFEGLDSGEREFVFLNWLPEEEGTYELEASIDLADSNLENNIDKDTVKVFKTKEVSISFVDKDGNSVNRILLLGDEDLNVEETETFTIPDVPLDIGIALEQDDGVIGSLYLNSTLNGEITITSTHIKEPLIEDGLLLYEIFANNDSWEYESFLTLLTKKLEVLNIRYTELKSFMCNEYNFNADACDRWEEISSDTLIDRGELLLTAKTAQAQAFAIGDDDYDSDNKPDWDDDDSDNDGISDDEDTLTCLNGRFKSRNIFAVSVDGDEDIEKELKGKKEFMIKDESKKIVEFDIDFDKDRIDCREVTVEKQPEVTTRGYTLINGINLTNKTKTVYVDKIAGFNRVCIKDEEVESIDELSQNCDGSNEFLVMCDGIKHDLYTCTNLSQQYKVDGLVHSAVAEPTTCEESWACGDWSGCDDKTQTRTCADSSGCGTNFNKPSEQQSCKDEEEERDRGGSGSRSRTSVFSVGEIKDWNEGKTKSFRMRRNDMTTFKFNDKLYSIVLISIKGTHVKLSLSFKNAFISLARGETEKFDIDRDGKDDIAIIFESATLNKATIVLERLNPDIGKRAREVFELIGPEEAPEVKELEKEIEKPEIPEVAEVKKSGWIYAIISFGIVIGAVLGIFYFRTRLSREKPGIEEAIPSESRKSDYQRLESYIIKERNKGFSYERISNALIKTGWSKESVDYIIKNIKKMNK